MLRCVVMGVVPVGGGAGVGVGVLALAVRAVDEREVGLSGIRRVP